MSRLGKELIDRMVKDASWYDPERGPVNELMGDLSCHVKALARDVADADEEIERLRNAIRQLAKDHPDTPVSWPANGRTYYQELCDWARHVLDG